ncbi:DUF4352 domain-containing protein [Frankia tisae]|nr:DUF4352 domain-containing protein [Frankia tisae]
MPGATGNPYPPYPQSPSRRGPDRRQLALIIGIVVAALIAIAVVVSLPGRNGGGADSGRPPGSTAAQTLGASGAPSPTAGFGVPVTDGSLEFVVAGIDCSKTQIGDGILALRTAGKFCQAQVTVRNTGGTAEALDNSSELLWDDDGNQHEANFLARFKLGENLWDSIDPGETKHGTLVFDVPRDAQPRELEVHESSQSAGARIPVR